MEWGPHNRVPCGEDADDALAGALAPLMEAVAAQLLGDPQGPGTPGHRLARFAIAFVVNAALDDRQDSARATRPEAVAQAVREYASN